jgi:hypothetical protein
VKTIDEYEKFPICLHVIIEELSFKISLMPMLDILTLSAAVANYKSVFNVDSIFGGLFDKQKDPHQNKNGLV